MLEYLTKINPRRWQDDNISLRHPHTGLWFLTGPVFDNWLSHDNSKLWVHGIRKSILLGVMQNNLLTLHSWCWQNNSDVRSHDSYSSNSLLRLILKTKFTLADTMKVHCNS